MKQKFQTAEQIRNCHHIKKWHMQGKNKKRIAELCGMSITTVNSRLKENRLSTTF